MLFGGLLALWTMLPGCMESAITWAVLGSHSGNEIPARFKLPEGPLVILVDDYEEVVRPADARHVLVEALAGELKNHGVADRITTNKELAGLRQMDPDFDKRSIREVGRRANADTMIWIKPQAYAVQDDIETAHNDGRFTVKLKVFNILEEEKSKIRLWPDNREGEIISVTVNAHDIRACKSKSEVHRKMAHAIADQVAKLFYDHIEEQQ